MEPTGRLDDEESESFEAREASAPASGDREEWPLHVSNFVFVALSELVDAYVLRGVCREEEVMEAHGHLSLDLSLHL